MGMFSGSAKAIPAEIKSLNDEYLGWVMEVDCFLC
jgi:hypothetical protein